MSSVQILVMLFVLLLLIFFTLMAILLHCRYENRIWKYGLGICMFLSGTGTFAIFNSVYRPYTPLFLAWGVWLMLLAVAYVRFRKPAVSEEKPQFYRLIIGSIAAVMVLSILGAPALILSQNQQQTTKNQWGIIGLLNDNVEETKALREELKLARDERNRQHAQDSLQRAKIDKAVYRIDSKVSNGLQNDKDVKKALGKSNKATMSRPAFYVAPAPRQMPTGNLSQPSTDRVQPVQPVNRKGKRIGYRLEYFAPDTLEVARNWPEEK